ncbi:hypothetical protein AOLI_G00286180 [Acnodon oligacanthus]
MTRVDTGGQTVNKECRACADHLLDFLQGLNHSDVSHLFPLKYITVENGQLVISSPNCGLVIMDKCCFSVSGFPGKAVAEVQWRIAELTQDSAVLLQALTGM